MIVLSELAKALDISVRTINTFIGEGMPATKVKRKGGTGWLWSADVEVCRAWIKEHRKKMDDTRLQRRREKVAAAKKLREEGMQEAKTNLYIAGLQFDYFWSESEVRAFIVCYSDLKKLGTNEEGTTRILAERFKRKPGDVMLLILDLTLKGVLSPTGKGKANFIWGKEL
jgi:hypothetical protein